MVAALGMVAAMAAPAMAEVNFTGFYRAKGYVTNFYTGGAGDWTHSSKTNATPGVTLQKDAPTASYVDQRFRGKFTAGDENVKAVLFLEHSAIWGQAGADLSGDSTDKLAIKNAYLWFKVPDAPVDVTAGLQNVTDAYQGVFFGAADVAGLFVTAKPSESLALRVGAAIPYQPSIKTDESVKLFLAEAKFAAGPAAKIGANLYFLQDKGAGATAFWKPFDTTAAFNGSETGRTNIYMPGVDFAVNAGIANISGFAFYQFGERKFDNTIVNPEKLKFGGYAGDLRADVKAGPANVFLEGLYVSGHDFNSTGNKYKGVVVLDDYDFGSGSSTYSRNDMVLLTPAADSIGTAGALTYDMNNHGAGVIHVAAGAKMDVAPKTTAKLGVGYLRAAKAFQANAKKEMGTEVNATINYNLQKGLDVSGTAAYAFLGKGFTDATTGARPDADDPYALIAKVNYAF